MTGILMRILVLINYPYERGDQYSATIPWFFKYWPGSDVKIDVVDFTRIPLIPDGVVKICSG